MESRTSSDILRRISLSMLLPYILVAITALIAILAFLRVGANIIALAVLIALPVGIFILVSYQRMLPLLLLSILVPATVPVIGVLQMSLDEIVIPGLFFIYVLQRMIHRSNYNRVSFYDIPKGVVLLLAIGIMWFIASGDILPQNIFGFEALGSFRAYFTFFLGIMSYFLLLSLIKDEKHIRQTMKALYWISLLSIVYLLSLVALNRENTPILPTVNWSIRYLGGSRFSIRSIAMSTAALMLYLVSLVGEYPKNLKYKLPSLVLASITIVYSGGRGVFGGWILATLVYLYAKRRYLILTGISLLAMTAVGVPALFPKTVEQLPESFRRVFEFRIDPAEKSAGSRSWEVRLAMWKVSLEDIKKHPITGVGFRGLAVDLAIYGQLSGEELFIEMGVTSGSTHNAYIAYAQIFGIPSLILFLLIYLNHVRRTWKLYRNHPDPHVHNISLFLVMNFAAYFLIQLGGGGPKDVAFFTYLGLAQAIWILVLNNQKMPASKETTEQIAAVHPAFSAAVEG